MIEEFRFFGFFYGKPGTKLLKILSCRDFISKRAYFLISVTSSRVWL
jgi:hypothetical protein